MAGRRYLFDTNILSDLIKRPSSPLARRIGALTSEDFCTSIVVACELRYGAGKKSSRALTAKVGQLLANIDALPLEADIDRHYASIRVAVERSGQTIGHNDLFVGAHARAPGLTQVTDNVREFSRVPGLAVENRLIPPI